MNRFMYGVWLCATVLLFAQCKDDDDDMDNVIPPSAAACVIQQETTSLISNEALWTYEYATTGFPSKITREDKYGNITDILDVFGDRVSKARITPGVPNGTVVSIRYEGDYLRSLPPRGFMSITSNGVTTVDYEIYLFTYDGRGRIITITEQSPNVFNDLEWELTIWYNEADNPTRLQYEFLTGPRAASTIIDIDSYDNNPTPHSGVPGWRFLMYNHTWNNHDPGPVIEALSRNNALHYTYYADGVKKWETTMAYEYNEDGFPTHRTITDENENGVRTYAQTYSYACQ